MGYDAERSEATNGVSEREGEAKSVLSRDMNTNKMNNMITNNLLLIVMIINTIR